MSDKPLWIPDEERRRSSRLAAFMRLLGERHDVVFDGYRDLHAWSLANMAEFWSALWDFAAIAGEKGEPPFVTEGEAFWEARFFPRARLNYAENLLRKRGSQTAIVFRNEAGDERRLSWDGLRREVARLQQALRAAGVGPGDRVAGIVPNMPEAIIAMLAAASIGAVWSSCSPDFGPRGILDRFGQIGPKVLFACDGYYYNGKTFDITPKLAEVMRNLPTVTHLVLIDHLGRADEAAGRLPRATGWESFVAAFPQAQPEFEPLPFDHPLFILFSSGTTGVPKCIVHRAGGLLLKHHCELALQGDVREDDRLFYFTTCGWMMWNWLASGLAVGATLLLYDGSPFHPGPETLFRYAEAHGMTHFGTSAKYIDALRKSGLRPAEAFNLAPLRTMFSTGSPLSPENFDFVYEAVKTDLHLASISGGTDICGCFVAGNPLQPVWRGEIQGPVLGMAVDVFDDDGRPLPPGRLGELVCTRPFPSMPLKFWNDPEGRRFRAAYFERFPGVWHHGDFAEWTSHGGMIIHGRSDATLNPGGVRIGTAEIYAQVEQMPEVVEALAIGQKTPDNDERIVLFVRLAEGVELTDALREEIRRRIRTGASPRHVPAVIAAVPDIPRTRSGKIVEIAVRDVVHGRPVKNVEALANPEALEYFRDRPELRFD
jgi:acetoacetyl-CoA synthetase